MALQATPQSDRKHPVIIVQSVEYQYVLLEVKKTYPMLELSIKSDVPLGLG